MNYALILSGGSGTRLWPLSRRARPKHLIPLVGNEPLLEQTLERLDDLIPPEQRFIITIPEQAPIVRDTARGRAAGIIIEPRGKNNLLPMALSARMIHDRDPESIIAFLPSDHSISEAKKLSEALKVAFKVAARGYIVTIGIPTRYPESNYGHIQRGEEIPGMSGGDFTVYGVKKFHEKPTSGIAHEYHENSEWYWNSGIFVFATSDMLELVEKTQPELSRMLDAGAPALSRENPTIDNPVIDWESSDQISAIYKKLPPRLQTSIDYALMEKAERVATIPVEMGWTDLGGFAALADLLEPDNRGNRIAPRYDDEDARVLLPGSKNVSIFPDNRAVVCIDCEDLIVVDTRDAVLILPRNSSGRVRDVVEHLRQIGWHDLE